MNSGEYRKGANIQRPRLLTTLAEARTAFVWPELLLKAPSLLRAPKGDGRTVLLTPGYLAGDLSMEPLAAYLKRLGYAARPWGLGRNDGDVHKLVAELGAVVERLVEANNEPVTLIGWSLGGVIARETARDFPDAVREIVTLGTPIIGGPKYTAVGEFYARQYGIDLDEFESEIHERNRTGLRQPVTSIYSKSDGIVAWRASVDTYNKQARNIEVRASHFSLGINPQAWRIIADTLAGNN